MPTQTLEQFCKQCQQITEMEIIGKCVPNDDEFRNHYPQFEILEDIFYIQCPLCKNISTYREQ